MGVRLLDINNPEPLLRTRDNVQFIGNWPVAVRDCFLQVGVTQQIRRQNIAILQRGAGNAANVWDLQFNDANGFLPRSESTLYEIRLSIRLAGEMYVIWPTPSTYFDQLENATFRPDPTSDSLRYVGFFEQNDLGTPENNYQERLLRLTTVKDMQPILLRFYSETIEQDDKVLIDMLINRCQIFKFAPEQRPQAWRPVYSYEQFNFTTAIAPDSGIATLGQIRA